MKRFRKVLVVVFGTLAAISTLVWFASFFGTQRAHRMAETGERFGIGGGFIYVNASRPLDEQTRATIAEMDRIQNDPIARIGLRTSSLSTSRGSGDGIFAFGWTLEEETRAVGNLSAVVDHRLVYWIGPWIGIVPFILLGAVLLVADAIRAHRKHSRVQKGLCVACGYDLQATPDRCPECGARAGAS